MVASRVFGGGRLVGEALNLEGTTRVDRQVDGWMGLERWLVVVGWMMGREAMWTDSWSGPR